MSSMGDPNLIPTDGMWKIRWFLFNQFKKPDPLSLPSYDIFFIPSEKYVKKIQKGSKERYKVFSSFFFKISSIDQCMFSTLLCLCLCENHFVLRPWIINVDAQFCPGYCVYFYFWALSHLWRVSNLGLEPCLFLFAYLFYRIFWVVMC